MNEERNVLDDLLLDINGEDEEDFDAELKAAKTIAAERRSQRNNDLPAKKSTLQNNGNKSGYQTDKKENKTYNNNGRQQQQHSSPTSIEGSCDAGSQYSCDSGSCSCEDHSSIHDNDDGATGGGAGDRNASPDTRRRSYQSFTRSPSYSRTVAKSSSSPSLRDGNRNRKRRHVYDDGGAASGGGLKRRRRHAAAIHDDDDVMVDDVDDDDGGQNIKKKDKSSKRRDYTSLIKYFFKDSCYFVMKSNNEENVEISKREGVWSTPLPNEIKLNSAFKQFRNVILIFSVKESGKFQGFARLASEAQYDLEPVKWVLPPGIQTCPFGGVFLIDWICRNELPFAKTSHLYNAFNEAKPVKIARDGQEIEPKVGEELCRLFPADDLVDLIPFLKRMKKQTLNRPRKRHSRGPFMHEFDAVPGAATAASNNHRHHQAYHRSSLKPSTSLSLSTMTNHHHDHQRRQHYSGENYYGSISSISNRLRDDEGRFIRLPRRSDSYGGGLNGYNNNGSNSSLSHSYHHRQSYGSDSYNRSRYSSHHHSSSYANSGSHHQLVSYYRQQSDGSINRGSYNNNNNRGYNRY